MNASSTPSLRWRNAQFRAALKSLDASTRATVERLLLDLALAQADGDDCVAIQEEMAPIVTDNPQVRNAVIRAVGEPLLRLDAAWSVAWLAEVADLGDDAATAAKTMVDLIRLQDFHLDPLRHFAGSHPEETNEAIEWLLVDEPGLWERACEVLRSEGVAVLPAIEYWIERFDYGPLAAAVA